MLASTAESGGERERTVSTLPDSATWGRDRETSTHLSTDGNLRPNGLLAVEFFLRVSDSATDATFNLYGRTHHLILPSGRRAKDYRFVRFLRSSVSSEAPSHNVGDGRASFPSYPSTPKELWGIAKSLLLRL